MSHVKLGGVNVSDAIEHRGTPVIIAETHDEDGNQTMGELQLALSNMEGQFTPYLSLVDPIQEEIRVGGNLVFKGSTTSEGISSDRDQEIVYVSALAAEHELIERMRSKKCEELAALAAGRWRKFNILTGDFSRDSYPEHAEGRWFLALDELLAVWNDHECPIASALTGVDLSAYFIGGTVFHKQPQLPDITWWDLFRGVAEVWNAIIYMEGGTLKFKEKSVMLSSAATPISLPLIRESLRETNRRVGYDKVEIRYDNGNDDSVWSGATVGIATATREGVTDPVRILEKKLALRIPNTATNEFHGFYRALIDRSTDATGYLIHNPQASKIQHPADWGLGEFYPEYSWTVLASDILKLYECELLGLTEWEAEYSIMDDPDAIVSLIAPLHPFRRRGESGTRHFIRSARIDVAGEQVHVNVMRYA